MDGPGSTEPLVPQKQGMTGTLVFAIFSAALGMVNFGYNTGVINAPQSVMESFYNETYIEREGVPIPSSMLNTLWAFSVSSFAIGGMIGGLMGGWWADRFGRKLGMLLNAPVGVAAGALMGFSKLGKSYEMVIIGRLLVGFNCGLYTGLTPMYNSEVAPADVRGAVGTINQLGVVTALSLSQILGLSEILGNEEYWPLLLGLTGFIPLLQLLLLPFVPESPRYLMINKSQTQAATSALMKLRGASRPVAVKVEMDEMQREQVALQSAETMSVKQVFTTRWLWKPLIISVTMHLSQQLSGINCIFYYSTTLFTSVGLSSSDAQYATLAVGGIMIVMTLVSIPLMDVAGRRSLHLVGLGGMFVCSVGFTVAFKLNNGIAWVEYTSIVMALLIVLFFALGPGSIPWMIVAELFGQGPRPIAISLSVLVNWLANFAVGQLFPYMQEALQELVFIPFTVLLFIFFTVLYFILPETKNKTIEEITAIFNPDAMDSKFATPYSSGQTPNRGYASLDESRPNSADLSSLDRGAANGVAVAGSAPPPERQISRL